MVVFVQRPAPAFTATAVVEGEFKDISLSEFLGQWYASLRARRFVRAVANINFVCQGGSFLLSNVKMIVFFKRRILTIAIVALTGISRSFVQLRFWLSMMRFYNFKR
jgi:hypothetical protein